MNDMNSAKGKNNINGADGMNVLELKKVSKTFAKKKLFSRKAGGNQAVKEVSLSLMEGKCLGLVGESGCGKSTLGKIICGLEKPTFGEITLRGPIHMVFQDSFSAVNPRFTAADIIREPVANHLKLTKKEENALIEKLLVTVGLHREDAQKRPQQFSGGQLQRICLARAIAVKPKLIVLDEPTSSLDVSVQAQILNLLNDLKKEYQLTYLFISHDLEAVYYLADALAVMYMGTVVEYIEDIASFKSLAHPYTRKLLKSVLTLDAAGEIDEQLVAASWHDEPVPETEQGQGCLYAARCHMKKEICLKAPPSLKVVSEGHQVACYQITDSMSSN